MNIPVHPQSQNGPAMPGLSSVQPTIPSGHASTGFEIVDSLHASMKGGMDLDQALRYVTQQDLHRTQVSDVDSEMSLRSQSKLETGFDMIEKLEVLLKEGVDLEQSITKSKKQVTDLAAHCGVHAEPVQSSSQVSSPNELPRSLFSPHFLASWLETFALPFGGKAGIVLVSGRGKVCHTHYVGWDNAPFRVHSDLVNKVSLVAIHRKGLVSSVDDQSEPKTEELEPRCAANPETTLCVSLNRLSRNVGHPLIVKAIELPQSGGKAVLLLDRETVDAKSFQDSLEKPEIQTLLSETDTWFLIRRFQWSLRLMESFEWFVSNPKAIAAILGLLVVLVMLPVPYYPSRKCVIEPETRQYIGSPVAGRIASCDVRPGDQVSKNQLLARLDDEQIQRDIVTAEAELERARKKLDSSMAQRAQGEVGLAKMDILRAQTKLESLQSQQQRMEVRASSAGIVIQGDWQRSIGMPVTLGQNLFEIAELSSMTAEVHLAADDLGHIRVGDKVAVRSDATGSTSFYGVISRIEPRATVNDEGAYFLADVVIEDPEHRLRPGMKASAQIVAGWRSIGWLLFSRPIRWLSHQWVW